MSHFIVVILCICYVVTTQSTTIYNTLTTSETIENCIKLAYHIEYFTLAFTWIHFHVDEGEDLCEHRNVSRVNVYGVLHGIVPMCEENRAI